MRIAIITCVSYNDKMILFCLVKQGFLFTKEGEVSKGVIQQPTNREFFFSNELLMCRLYFTTSCCVTEIAPNRDGGLGVGNQLNLSSLL